MARHAHAIVDQSTVKVTASHGDLTGVDVTLAESNAGLSSGIKAAMAN